MASSARAAYRLLSPGIAEFALPHASWTDSTSWVTSRNRRVVSPIIAQAWYIRGRSIRIAAHLQWEAKVSCPSQSSAANLDADVMFSKGGNM